MHAWTLRVINDDKNGRREREWAGQGLNVPRGSAGIGRVGDTSAMATPMEEVPLRGQGVRDTD